MRALGQESCLRRYLSHEGHTHYRDLGADRERFWRERVEFNASFALVKELWYSSGVDSRRVTKLGKS